MEPVLVSATYHTSNLFLYILDILNHIKFCKKKKLYQLNLLNNDATQKKKYKHKTLNQTNKGMHSC